MTEKSNTSTWRKMRIDDCFAIQQGKQVSKKNRQGDNQHPFLRTANVFWGRIDLSELDHMNFSAEEEKKFALKEGDILVCEGGDIGRSAMWHSGLTGCYYQNHLHRLRKLNDEIDENFVLFYLQYAFVYAKLYVGRANITTIPNLSKSRLAELEIVLPPIKEQKAIARALTVVQEAIARQTKLIAKLKELKQNMMQYLFTRGTKGEKTKMTEIGVVPESWDFEKASSFCDSVRDGTHDSPKRKDHGKYLVTSKNIINGKIDFSSCYNVSESDFALVNKRSKVDDNDVIYSMIGTLGEVAFIEKYNNDYCIKNVGLFKNKSKKAGLWLFYWLQSAHAKEYARQNIGGTTQKYLTLAVLRNFPVPVVSERESNLIVGALNCLDVRLQSEEEKLHVYQKLFKTLLHELMSGGRRLETKTHGNI